MTDAFLACFACCPRNSGGICCDIACGQPSRLDAGGSSREAHLIAPLAVSIFCTAIGPHLDSIGCFRIQILQRIGVHTAKIDLCNALVSRLKGIGSGINQFIIVSIPRPTDRTRVGCIGIGHIAQCRLFASGGGGEIANITPRTFIVAEDRFHAGIVRGFRCETCQIFSGCTTDIGFNEIL